MIWLWTLPFALASDLKAGLGACDDGDLRGALEPLDLALADPKKVKAKWRGDALACRARAILVLDEPMRGPRVEQAARDLLAAAELGAVGPELEEARAEASDLLLASIVDAFQPGASEADREQARPMLDLALELAESPLGRVLAVKATLSSDLDAAMAHAKAALEMPQMVDEHVSVALIAASPVPELIEAERFADAAALITAAEAALPGMQAEGDDRADAEAKLAKLRLEVALADPDAPVGDLKALAATPPESPVRLALLGTRLLDAGEEGLGLELVEKAEAADPEKAEIPFNLGAHYINAAANLAEAEPDAADLTDRVKALMAKARAPLERALAIDGDDEGTLKALLQVCEHLDDRECVRATKKKLE